MDNHAAIAAQNIFSLAHPEFYETLAHYPFSSEYVDRLKELLPDSWILQRNEVWMHAHYLANERALTPPVIQGFKIHVSCTPRYALRVLALVVPVCVQEDINFKIAGDPNLLRFLNSKQQGRGHSGKFMTIYPPDEEIFKDLIEHLYQQTKNEVVEGPYILSDRRYKDSKLLFYRYGGFHPPHRLNIDGTETTFLVSPTGEYVPDQRLPYFQLPDWVRDPFAGTLIVENEGDPLLNDQYLIEGVLSFSNAGGVYYGTDTTTGQSIVIKEARPFTNYWNIGERFWDAVHLLEREYAVLHRLKNLDFVPKPIDLFQDWEHTFLVEERVEGLTLNSFWAQEDMILTPYIRQEGRIEGFVSKFKHIAETLIRMVMAVHERGVLLGDLSPRNILINAETLHMWFIDFESAIMADDAAEMLTYATQWGTSGFMNRARASRNELLPQDDLYALGMTLYNCVVPVNYLFTLNPQAEVIFLDKLVELGVPVEVKAVIYSLLCGAAEEAQNILTNWNTTQLASMEARTSVTPHEYFLNNDALVRLTADLKSTSDNIARYILQTSDYERSDRLWPSHFLVFATNALNVAYGASGSALFLQDVLEELPTEVTAWMLKQPLSVETYPPGLYLGLAGIAYTFQKIGFEEKAETVMKMLYQSSLLYKEPNMFLGAAGWGLVSLNFFILTGKQVYLDQAVQAGEYILQTAQHEGETCYWRCNQDERVHYGFGYGACGIALFLLYLHLLTKKEEFRTYAIQGLEFDLVNKVESKVGWQWKRFQDDIVLYPYWIHGSAGVGSTLIRFYSLLGIERYKTLACQIANDTFIKYAFSPNLFDGLTGIGEFMLDMFHFTGEEAYRHKAFDIADTILWFKIDKPEGVAYPGQWLSRISNDYGSGSAGIGLFFKRLLHPRERLFVDLDLEAVVGKRNSV